MTNQKSKFMVGLFMLSGIIIALVAIIWLGMSRFFEEGKFYVTYFDQSVQGLNIDSPVKYRGVSIGRVERIEVAPDSRLIKVVLKIDTDIKMENDMIAQLKVVGITGSMFIEMDRQKPEEPDFSPHINFPSEYPIISSKPSEISQLFRGLDDIMKQVGAMDLPGVSERAKNTLDTIHQGVVDLKIADISSDIQKSLDNLNRDLDSERWDTIIANVGQSTQSFKEVLDNVNTSLTRINNVAGRFEQLIAKNESNVTEALENFRDAMTQTHGFIDKASSMVSSTDENITNLTQQLLVVTNNLEDASANLNDAMENLSYHPAQLLFGDPPPARIIDTGASN